MAGKRKDVISNTSLQPLVMSANYVNLEQLSQDHDLDDDSPRAVAQRAEVSTFGSVLVLLRTLALPCFYLAPSLPLSLPLPMPLLLFLPCPYPCHIPLQALHFGIEVMQVLSSLTTLCCGRPSNLPSWKNV